MSRTSRTVFLGLLVLLLRDAAQDLTDQTTPHADQAEEWEEAARGPGQLVVGELGEVFVHGAPRPGAVGVPRTMRAELRSWRSFRCLSRSLPVTCSV